MDHRPVAVAGHERAGQRAAMAELPSCRAKSSASVGPGTGRTPALAARLRDRPAGLPGVRLLDRGPAPVALVTFAVEGWQARAGVAELTRR
ncbi:hypothetical protein GCM10022419_002690 [Nonomuraea rosea]|uniref:Uncharacterized protein n=1 Tax=Nonomuraea rosea TaxID=638574 RepID=A0ABP6V502_9ACTN